MQHLHSNSTRNLAQRPLDSVRLPKKDRPSNATLKKLQSERKIPKPDPVLIFPFPHNIFSPPLIDRPEQRAFRINNPTWQ